MNKKMKKISAAVGLFAVAGMTASGINLSAHADSGGGGGTGTWVPGNSSLTNPRWYVNSSDPDPNNLWGIMGDVNNPSGAPGTAWYYYTHTTTLGGTHTIAEIIDQNLPINTYDSNGNLVNRGSGLDGVFNTLNVDQASRNECLMAQRVFNLGDQAYSPVVQYVSLAGPTDTRTYDNWNPGVSGNDMVQKFNSYDETWRNQFRVNDLLNNPNGDTPQPILICLNSHSLKDQDVYPYKPAIDIEKYFDDMGPDSGPTYDAAGNVTNDGYASDFDTDPRTILPNKEYPIRFTISNKGTEDLKDINVTDQLTSGTGAIKDLNCTFPDGSTGTTWAGDFKTAARFDCTGTLPGMDIKQLHTDTATVVGTGVHTGTQVTDSDLLNAKTPNPSVNIQKYFPDMGKPTYDAQGNVTNDGFFGDFDTTLAGIDGTKETPVEFTISNNGDEALTNISVADKLDSGVGDLKNISCTFPDGSKGLTWNGTLNPAERFTCSATLPALGNPKNHADTASVNAIGQLSKAPVSANDKLNAGTPHIDIEKYSKEDGSPTYDAQGNVTNDGYNGDFDTTYKSMKGDQPITFTISNNGYEALTNIKVTDQVTEGKGKVENLNCTFPDGKTGVTWQGTLNPAERFNCTANITGLSAGEKHTDIATVVGDGVQSKQTVTDKDAWKGQEPTPNVNIQKWSEGEDKPAYDDKGNITNDGFQGDYDSKPKYVPASEKIHFTISNNGTEPLVDIKLSDKTLSGANNVENISCTFPDGSKGVTWNGPLAVGKQFDCTGDLKGVDLGTFHSDQGLIEAVGQYTKTPVKDTDIWNGENPNPSINIQKFNNGEETPAYDAKGNVTNDGFKGDYDNTYKNVTSQDTPITMTISNNGTEDLTKINVSDKTTEGNVQIKDLSCTFPDGSKGTSWDGILPVGKQFSCTGVVPKLDFNANHTDQGLVTAKGVLSGKDVSAQDLWKAHNTDQPPVPPTQPPAPAVTTIKTGEASIGTDPALLGFGAITLVGAGAGTVFLVKRRKN